MISEPIILEGQGKKDSWVIKESVQQLLFEFRAKCETTVIRINTLKSTINGTNIVFLLLKYNLKYKKKQNESKKEQGKWIKAAFWEN